MTTEEIQMPSVFVRHPREDEWTFVTAPNFPGFSFVMKPKEDDTALNSVFLTYLAVNNAALSPPEPTEGQVERAIDLAMSWQPSERGLSYAERRREVMDLLMPALRAMPLQDHGWQDISTAPSDGRMSYFYLEWADDCARLNEPLDPNASQRFFHGKWRCWGSVYKATHWQPCLAPTIAPAILAEDQTSEAKS